MVRGGRIAVKVARGGGLALQSIIEGEGADDPNGGRIDAVQAHRPFGLRGIPGKQPVRRPLDVAERRQALPRLHQQGAGDPGLRRGRHKVCLA